MGKKTSIKIIMSQQTDSVHSILQKQQMKSHLIRMSCRILKNREVMENEHNFFVAATVGRNKHKKMEEAKKKLQRHSERCLQAFQQQDEEKNLCRVFWG